MRFITQFESTYEAFGKPNFDKYINAYKGRGELELGAKIGEVFGWKEDQKRFKTLNTLEIETFPMDKWVEFKKRFYDALPDYDIVSKTRLINALSELESVMDTQKLPG